MRNEKSTVNVPRVFAVPLRISPPHVAPWRAAEAEVALRRLQATAQRQEQAIKQGAIYRPKELQRVRRLIAATQGFLGVLKGKQTPST